MFSWFRLTRSISGVYTTGVPLAELSLYNTYRTEAQCPRGPVRHTEPNTDHTHTYRTAFIDLTLLEDTEKQFECNFPEMVSSQRRNLLLFGIYLSSV